MRVDHDKVNRELRRRFDEWCQGDCPLPRFDGTRVVNGGPRCPNPNPMTLRLWLNHNAPTFADRCQQIWEVHECESKGK